MPGHEKRDDRARRVGHEVLIEFGREIRTARLGLDLSAAQASQAIGRSKSTWSRIELGQAVGLTVVDLVRALAVVGLQLHARAYPGGSPVRDAPHLALLQRLRAMLGEQVSWRTEVPLPRPGDQRAWDALMKVAGIRVGVEAETRARDAQALQRRLALKRRDGGVEHVLLLLSNTRHNREFLRTCGAGFLADFPVDGRDATARLARGEDPGGSAIVLL
jgi:transcriptional regulator with XRE-family HTH domain